MQPRLNIHSRHLLAACLVLMSLSSTAQAHASSSEEPERFALLVGVDAYAKPMPGETAVEPLEGPGTDLELIKNLLTSNTFKFKDDKTHIKILRGSDATHLAIKQWFNAQLIDNAARHPNAIFVFYFSGHGSQANHVASGDDTQHDTLLAYDSRAGAGDILDDELADWFEKLRANTPNTTFILDSCHSGSAIKAPDRVARIAPPSRKQNSGLYLGRNVPPVNATNTVVPRRKELVLLSGSKPEESSFECDTLDCAIPNGPTHYGFFTYYLTRELLARPTETNDAAIEHVREALTKVSPYQTPNAVGNVEGRVLSGIGESEDVFIHVQSLPKDNQFQILAGAPAGLAKGTFLAVYSAETNRLVGDQGKIANARVTSVGSTISTAALSDAPTRPLTMGDKVAVVTPFFGFEPLKIRLPALASVSARQLTAKLTPMVQADKLLQLVSPGEPFDIAVAQGCVSAGTLVVASSVQNAPKQCAEAYYLTEAHGDSPLFSAFVLASDDQAAETLAFNLEKKAKQNNVKALDNAQSPLSGLLKIRAIKVSVLNDTITPVSAAVNDGPQQMNVGQNFQIQLENQSNQDLYVAIYALGTSGTVTLLTVNPHGDLLSAHQKYTTHIPWEIGLPLGSETYKAFASTSSKVDYRLLEQSGAKRGDANSPFEWLLNQATNTRSRDDKPNQNLNLNDWTTVSIEFDVRP